MMAFADDPLLTVMIQQTEWLLASAASFTDADVAAPSLLPGWSRGHVLAHLARNADGFANLARTASTGVESPMYLSREARNTDIERDAARPLAAHLLDLRESADRLHVALADVPADALDSTVATGMGARWFVRGLPWMRLREIAYHHVDLGCGVTFDDLPDEVLRAGLLECQGRLAVALTARCRLASGEVLAITLTDPDPDPDPAPPTPDAGTAVSGAAGAVLGWLTGRTAGDGVVKDGGGPLPDVPSWG